MARHRWAVVDHFAKDQSAIFFQRSLTDVTAVVAAVQKIHLLVANTIITGVVQIRCRPSLSGNTNGLTSVPAGAHLSDMAVHSNMHPSACF